MKKSIFAEWAEQAFVSELMSSSGTNILNHTHYFRIFYAISFDFIMFKKV